VGGRPQLRMASTASSLSHRPTPTASAPRSLVPRYRGISLPPTCSARAPQAVASSFMSSLPWPSPNRIATGPPGFLRRSWEASLRTSAAAVHLHLGALERTVKQTPEQEGLLVGDVLRKRNAKLGAFAFDPGGDRVDGVGPRRLSPGDQRRAQARRIVDVGVVETAPVADP